MTKKELWTLSEWQTACHRVRHFNEELLAHRESVAGVELDMILRSRLRKRVWTIVEVKTHPGHLWEYRPISWRQSLRLERAAIAIQERWELERVELKLAVVSHAAHRYLEPKVRYFDIETESLLT